MARSRRVAFRLELEWPHKRHSQIYAGAQRYAAEQGWESIIDEFVAEHLPARRGSMGLPYDGILARVTPKLAEQANRLGIPLVNVWISSPAWDRVPGVFSDCTATGRLAAEHLLARGLRRFATIANKSRAATIEATAFAATVREAGFACLQIEMPLYPAQNYAAWQATEQRYEAFMDQWLPPVGVFINEDPVARQVAQMCRRRNWCVPQDVAIVCAHNEEASCCHPRPSLTSVDRAYDRVGYEAARRLDELMHVSATARRRRSSQASPRQILIPPQGVVVRESTDFFAIDDPLIAAALDYISAHGHRAIRQDDVARAVGVEVRTLQRRFGKVLNQPIMMTIRHLRLERAKRELTQSDRTLEEIARAVGFGVAARMNDAFRRELGVTPSRYRQERKGIGGPWAG